MRLTKFLLLCLLASLCLGCAQQTDDGLHWVSAWGAAQQLSVETRPDWVEPPPPELRTGPQPPSPIPPYPEAFADETLRMVVRTSLGGNRLRLTFSNALGMSPVRIGAVHVALHERDSAIVGESDRSVTFGGQTSFAIQPGALVVSDPVEFAIPALAEIAVSVYLPEHTDGVTTHELGLNTTYVARGNTASAASLPDATTNRTYFWLAGIDVLAPSNAGAIVTFGDSITDGFSSTANAHQAWPDLLAARLNAQAAKSPWGVVNVGISGNRVRRELVGASGLARFDRDVLSRAGVKWLVLFEGINDITFSALPRVPANQRTTAQELIEALSQLVDRAHAHGVKVMGGTLMPMGGLWLHNPETEAMRLSVNEWIRNGGKFDAVVDFDAATRDPEQPARLRPEFDSGDHIHPNDAGNSAMADAIDTSVFDR
jgi:lysophospholipase L1-like esterase